MASNPLLLLRSIFIVFIVFIHIALLDSSVIVFISALSSSPSWSLSLPEEYSIIKDTRDVYRKKYVSAPTSAPSSAPNPPLSSCEMDLDGIGSFDTLCQMRSSLELTEDIHILGSGSFEMLDDVELSCPVAGCSLVFNLSGEIRMRNGSAIVAGSIYFEAWNVTLAEAAVVNASALGGDPPEDSTGVPLGTFGDGGGYGGRGASCYKEQDKSQGDSWGGDAYGWLSLMYPYMYGSKGGTTSREVDYGGGGGGRVRILASDMLEFRGTVLADGGDAGELGGGGSGGSIFLTANKMKGNGKLSASGGNGVAGGSGGRVSIDVFSRHDEQKFFVHGGRSMSCQNNNGGAGTLYDTIPKSLTVNNHNLSTESDTLLMEFPKKSLWTNVFVKDRAKVAVPLPWSRVQVQGQLSILSGGILSFGVTGYPYSEFELMAEELLVSDSTIRVFGALRMSIKMLLMWNSRMLIDSGGDVIVGTSLLEASNLIVLKGASMIHSNSNLGVHGQGYLSLSGPGDVIEAQRLILSLFYRVQVGPGSVLRGPLENATVNDMAPMLNCAAKDCPIELLHPPEDCNLNTSLSFTLQICRVEDISVEGIIQGNVIHIHRSRSVVVHSEGAITASGLGCKGGIGRGEVLGGGLGGGGGYGGRGGDGSFNGTRAEGGISYGNLDLPCFIGSGSGNDSIGDSTAGGGIVVMGSMEHELSSLSVYGSIATNGESYGKSVRMLGSVATNRSGGIGGGSGGTILLFLQSLDLGNDSIVSSNGGNGCPNGGGGGGGGRVHFHWSFISTGDRYLPVANVKGNLTIRQPFSGEHPVISHDKGGLGHGHGFPGDSGSLTGKACPKGLYGVFCLECPLGTFKNVTGSDESLCYNCPSTELPRRGVYIKVRGGVSDTPCPYKCLSSRYHMPLCFTTLEELIYTFGGPWLCGLLLFCILFISACVLSVARMKFVSTDDLSGPTPTHPGSQIDHSLPFLESLNEVLETNRAEESESHVHRMYFMDSNTFSEPWHLPHSPPFQIQKIVYEDDFSRFVDDINTLASYKWWEGSVYIISSILAYPVAWSWQQWRRKKKLQRLREFVRSEYDHSCLRSCRSRALYEGLKVAATPDLMLAYVDFFLGGDEKRPDLPPRLHQRFPFCLIFGGDGSYMAPFTLHSDSVITNLMSQAVPSTKWFRLVAGLNAQLRLVRRGQLKSTLQPVISWLKSHADSVLNIYGISINLAWFHATAPGYCQLGLVIGAIKCEPVTTGVDGVVVRASKFEHLSSIPYNIRRGNSSGDLRTNENNLSKSTVGGIIDSSSLQMLEERRDIFYPFSLILHNTKPVGHQDLVGLIICIVLLADISLVMLTFLQLYSFSLGSVFLALFVLPLGLFLPFPVGISALFSHGPKKSASLSHEYSMWNITSLVNVVVAFLCGFVHYMTQSASTDNPSSFQPLIWGIDDSGWWIFPLCLLLCKCFQARLIDWHVGNLEIQDRTLYSNDPSTFWRS